MKRYVVTLDEAERDELSSIASKGSQRPQKVINALILLNCDEGEFNECRASGASIADILRISMRKVDPGEEALRGGRTGGGAGRSAGTPSCVCAQGRR